MSVPHADQNDNAGTAHGGDVNIDALVRGLFDNGGGDLLLVGGSAPMTRSGGRWTAADVRPMEHRVLQQWALAHLERRQATEFGEHHSVDASFVMESLGRVRLQLRTQGGVISVMVRAIPQSPRSFEDLGLPFDVQRLGQCMDGLVLVAGGFGHGKTTTLTALLDLVQRNRVCHIISIEEPVELMMQARRSMFEQRGIGTDAVNPHQAVMDAARQAPDVLVIGDLRDRPTIATAIQAAESGILVLACMTTSSTTQALSELIDLFPAERQPLVRNQLASCLRGIVCQRLMPTRDGGVTPAVESLFATDAVRRAIREDDRQLIYGMIETGRNAGMRTMERSLADLVMDGTVEMATARSAAPHVERFDRLLIAGRSSAVSSSPAPQPTASVLPGTGTAPATVVPPVTGTMPQQS